MKRKTIDALELTLVTLSYVGMVIAAILFIRSQTWFELSIFAVTFITLLITIFVIPELVRAVKDKNEIR